MITIIAEIVYLLTAIVIFCGVCVWICYKHQETKQARDQQNDNSGNEMLQQLATISEKLNNIYETHAQALPAPNEKEAGSKEENKDTEECADDMENQELSQRRGYFNVFNTDVSKYYEQLGTTIKRLNDICEILAQNSLTAEEEKEVKTQDDILDMAQGSDQDLLKIREDIDALLADVKQYVVQLSTMLDQQSKRYYTLFLQIEEASQKQEKSGTRGDSDNGIEEESLQIKSDINALDVEVTEFNKRLDGIFTGVEHYVDQILQLQGTNNDAEGGSDNKLNEDVLKIKDDITAINIDARKYYEKLKKSMKDLLDNVELKHGTKLRKQEEIGVIVDSLYSGVGKALLKIKEEDIEQLEEAVKFCYEQAKEQFNEEQAKRQVGSFRQLLDQIISALPDYIPEPKARFDANKMEDIDNICDYKSTVKEVVNPGKKCGTVIIIKAQVRVQADNE